MDVLRIARHLVYTRHPGNGDVVVARQELPPLFPVLHREYLFQLALCGLSQVGVELTRDQVFPTKRYAQLEPEPRLDAPDTQVSPVAATVHVVVWRAAIQPHPSPGRDRPASKVLRHYRSEHVRDAVGHRNIDVLPFSGVAPSDHGGEYRGGGMKTAAGEVRNDVVRDDGRSPRMTYYSERPADRDVVDIMADQSRVRPVLTIS